MEKATSLLTLSFFFIVGCSESKKSQINSTNKKLPVYYELSTNIISDKSTEKKFHTEIRSVLKEKKLEIIEPEEAQKLLQQEMLALFDLYKSKNLSTEKYKEEVTKAINLIPSVARKLVFKLFNTAEGIDSIYVISGLFTNVTEKKTPDSLSFVNTKGLTSNLFFSEIIDSCNKKNIFSK